MKVVLAYSGGLDTAVILRWIRETYNAEVVAYTGDVGQGEDELEKARASAVLTGAADIVVKRRRCQLPGGDRHDALRKLRR